MEEASLTLNALQPAKRLNTILKPYTASLFQESNKSSAKKYPGGYLGNKTYGKDHQSMSLHRNQYYTVNCRHPLSRRRRLMPKVQSKLFLVLLIR